MKRYILTGILALLATAAPAYGQLTVGQRIRVSAPKEGIYSTTMGTIVELRPDSLVVEVRGLQENVARSSIVRLDVSEGRRSTIGATTFGAAMGLAAGYGAGWLHHKLAVEGEDVDAYSGKARDRRPLFVLGGGVLGAVVGALRPGERWKIMPLSFVASGGPSGGGAMLAVSHRF